MNEDTNPQPAAVVEPSTPLEAYRSAVEVYRECRRELAECEIDIDIARITKDIASLNVATFKKNRLLGLVHDARARIQDSAAEVVRWRGMMPIEDRPEKREGIVQRIVNKLLQS